MRDTTSRGEFDNSPCDGVDTRIEDGFLLDERLEPHEIAKIERTLLAEFSERPSSSPRHRRLILAAAAATLGAVFITSAILFDFSGGRQQDRSNPNPENRRMTIEIVRTDLPEAEPYTLILEFHPDAGVELDEVANP